MDFKEFVMNTVLGAKEGRLRRFWVSPEGVVSAYTREEHDAADAEFKALIEEARGKSIHGLWLEFTTNIRLP